MIPKACTALIILAIVASPVRSEVFTFRETNGNWGVANNWRDIDNFPGVPDGNDTAIIPTGKTCTLPNNDVRAARIVEVHGTLAFSQDSRLTLGDDDAATTSEVTGTIKSAVAGNVKIRLRNDVTIDGGGKIESDKPLEFSHYHVTDKDHYLATTSSDFTFDGSFAFHVNLKSDAKFVADDTDGIFFGPASGNITYFVGGNGGATRAVVTVTTGAVEFRKANLNGNPSAGGDANFPVIAKCNWTMKVADDNGGIKYASTAVANATAVEFEILKGCLDVQTNLGAGKITLSDTDGGNKTKLKVAPNVVAEFNP